MYGQYVVAVLKRALQRTTNLAEAVQVLVAVSTPGIAHLAGLQMPPTDNIFTYVGYALAAFVVFRVLFVAPYELWREHVGQIGTLNLRLAEPERLELTHMATIRAEKRLELAATIREFQWCAFYGLPGLNEHYLGALKLMGQAGVPMSFTKMFVEMADICADMGTAKEKKQPKPARTDQTFGMVQDLTEFLHGRITNDELNGKMAEYPDQPELPLPSPSAIGAAK